MLGFLKRKKQPVPQEPEGGTPDIVAPQPAGEDKLDLVEYLKSLPEIDDPFEPFPEEETQPEKNESEQLADYIRMRSAQSELSSRTMLIAECGDEGALLEQMLGSESCVDISSVQGGKDIYYYSDRNMQDNFAMIAMLVIEKDIPRTVAHMVRFHCKMYPAATPYDYFYRYPYHYTKPQLERALVVFSRDEQYADIEIAEAFNGKPYLYSKTYCSDQYGKALADFGEESATNS